MLILYFMLFLICFENLWSINVDYFVLDELKEDFVELLSYDISKLDPNIFNPDDYDIIITPITVNNFNLPKITTYTDPKIRKQTEITKK